MFHPIAPRSHLFFSFWFRFFKVSSALSRSGSIPLAGLSSARPLSIYSPLFGQATYSFSGIFPMGSSPIGLHSTPPTPGLVHVSRSYSLKSFGYDPVFKRAVRLFGVPLLPCSLSRFGTSQYFQRSLLLVLVVGIKPQQTLFLCLYYYKKRAENGNIYIYVSFLCPYVFRVCLYYCKRHAKNGIH